MRLRTLLQTTVATGIVAGGIALAYAWQPAFAPVARPAASGFSAEVIRNGEKLALIGDCRTCHTAPGGRVYAGGLAMPTPFGTIYSTNITPDPETGIGAWSEAAFKRAMRTGVNRQGQHLYPAFPYDHFALVTDADISALYAFFMTREPVVATAPANELPFPINIRLVLAGWKLLFLHPKSLQTDPAQDAVWNRGHYLVEGLGHCGACHRPRNLMGAEETANGFAGGEAEGWHAFALGSASQAAVPWTAEALEQYLADGFHPDHGVARGPMAPVVANMATMPRDDAAAMAAYLASLAPTRAAPPQRNASSMPPAVVGPSTGVQAATTSAGDDEGARIFAATCASCHLAGRDLPLGAVQLDRSTSVTGENPENLVNLILDGIPAANGSVDPIMPGFGLVLTDARITALAGYVREHFAGKAPWPQLEATITQARASRRVPASKP